MCFSFFQCFYKHLFLLNDGVYDTIPQPYPVTEYVEKELSWWQQLRLWLGNVLLAVLAGAAVYGVIRIKGKLF